MTFLTELYKRGYVPQTKLVRRFTRDPNGSTPRPEDVGMTFNGDTTTYYEVVCTNGRKDIVPQVADGVEGITRVRSPVIVNRYTRGDITVEEQYGVYLSQITADDIAFLKYTCDWMRKYNYVCSITDVETGDVIY